MVCKYICRLHMGTSWALVQMTCSRKNCDAWKLPCCSCGPDVGNMQVGEIVKELFGKEPSRGVNPDEVVAMGAAIQVLASGSCVRVFGSFAVISPGYMG